MANDKTPTTADELIALAVDSNRDKLMGFAKALEAMLRLAIDQRDELARNLGHSEYIEAFHEALAKLARGES